VSELYSWLVDSFVSGCDKDELLKLYQSFFMPVLASPYRAETSASSSSTSL